MHMADALLSPAVGATMWTATAATTAYCAKKVREQDDAARVPLMGVTGAFVFAAQMLNFTIPGTGSSGHLGGGLLLAVLLGPRAAFLVMASILGVQALFFGDGGLLALGANIFNLGVFPAFVAYPLIFKPIAKDLESPARVAIASVLAAVVGLQLGSLFVVFQTVFSGISALPLTSFALLMQPIHLAIGLVEGFVTAGVVLFVLRAQPDLLRDTIAAEAPSRSGMRAVLVGLLAATVVAGGVLSWFASTNPDGLEWSMEGVAGTAELEAPGDVHSRLSALQALTAFMPDYAFKSANDPAVEEGPAGGAAGTHGAPDENAPAWPAVDAGTSTAGLLGAAIVLAIVSMIGYVLRRRSALSRPTGAQDSPGAGS